MMILAKSYFSGAGGMDLGLVRAGLNVIQSYEIGKDRCATLRKNFEHVVNDCDITGITVLDQPGSDVIVGTFPCKRYSTMASISGTRTGDDLFLHFFRHIVLQQPEVYAIENVPGLKIFPVVMEAFTKLPGYYIHVECPVNSSDWLPQDRKRLILIGTKKPFVFRPPDKKRFKTIQLSDILEESPDIGELPKAILKRMTGAYRDAPIISDPATNDVAPCCLAHYAKDRSTRLVKDKRYPSGVRPYSVKEWARLQGFPDDFVFCGSRSEQYSQIGDAVSVPVAEWLGSEIMRYFKRRGL